MAVLNKLRNSTWVLILVLVSLILFVVSDYFSSNRRFGSGGDQSVGEIAGTNISLIEFDAKYKGLLAQLNSSGSEETQTTRDQASNYAWNQFVQTLIVDKEFERLGIDVSQEESGKLLYSDDAHPTIKQYFTRDGEFSASNVINFKNQYAKKDPKMMEQFELIIKQIILEVQGRKYSSLINKSIFGTTLDAEDDYFALSQVSNGKSITLNYGTIDDKTIKIEDSELKDYINNHKEEFKQKASRDLEYILINVSPSKEDSLTTKTELEGEMAAFAAADDDSAYVGLNSTVPFTNEYKHRGGFNKEIDSKLFNTPKDSVVGPFYAEGAYSIYKINDKKTDSLPFFHFLKVELPVKGTTKADTLEAIAAGKKLGIASNSAPDALDFFNSKTGTGEIIYAQDMGWQQQGSQVPEINKALETMSPGQSTVIKSLYGLSLIKLLEPRSRETIKVAEVRKMIQPLKATEDAAYEKASNFRSSLNGDKEGEFEAMCKKMGIAKSLANNVKESDRDMTNIPGTNEIVRWAFAENRKVGDYSDVISAENLLLVTHLVKIKKEGTAEVDDVREQVTRLVMNEKKAEILKAKFETVMKGATSMQQIALGVKSIVQPFENVNFVSNGVQFAGNDIKLVGIVCGLKLKQICKPVISNEGVHIFYVESTNQPELPKDLQTRKKNIFDQKKQQAYNNAFESLKKASDLKDERYKFY